MISKKFIFIIAALLVMTSANAFAVTYSSYVSVDNFNVGNLTITSTGCLDLQSYGIVRYTGIEEIEAYIKNGYNNGGWDGLGGIISSAAANDLYYASGIALIYGQDYLDYLGQDQFYNHHVGGSDSLIRYTYLGDANLDGKVNEEDFGLIETGMACGLSGWIWGDFDYDGMVTESDFDMATYVSTLDLPCLGAAYSVPEPSTIIMLISIAIGAIAWHRRRG
jgi:hypothetical protein